MSEQIDDGGPAFPIKEPLMSDFFGMTLRDYFAAQALNGMLANDADSYSFHHAAKTAYQFADAMLKARES